MNFIKIISKTIINKHAMAWHQNDANVGINRVSKWSAFHSWDVTIGVVLGK